MLAFAGALARENAVIKDESILWLFIYFFAGQVFCEERLWRHVALARVSFSFRTRDVIELETFEAGQNVVGVLLEKKIPYSLVYSGVWAAYTSEYGKNGKFDVRYRNFSSLRLWRFSTFPFRSTELVCGRNLAVPKTSCTGCNRSWSSCPTMCWKFREKQDLNPLRWRFSGEPWLWINFVESFREHLRNMVWIEIKFKSSISFREKHRFTYIDQLKF